MVNSGSRFEPFWNCTRVAKYVERFLNVNIHEICEEEILQSLQKYKNSYVCAIDDDSSYDYDVDLLTPLH